MTVTKVITIHQSDLHKSKKEKTTTDTHNDQHYRPLDYSFKEMSFITEIVNEEPRGGLDKKSKSIRLSNNKLTSLEGFDTALNHIMTRPQDTVWIDLSFNHLTTIDEVLVKYPNVKVLYLHANNITSLAQIDKLASFSQLRNLTLHGNPVEQAKGYRYHVISKLPQLKHLDFSAITKQDRQDCVKK